MTMILQGRKNRRILLFTAVLFLLTAATSVYARGARENVVLSRADQLIAEKEYDQALVLLTEFIRDNPGDFAQAQRRVQTIVRLREQSNRIMNELLDTLETEPENDDRILELINDLLTIESPTNPVTANFLSQVRFLAQLNVYRGRLEEIFLLARAQLAVNNFSRAMEIYASGFYILQGDYFTIGYSHEAERLAREALETIDRNIQQFYELQPSVNLSAQVISQLAAADLPSVSELRIAYTMLLPQMNELKAIQDSFFSTRRTFDAQLDMHQADDETLGDRSFLTLAGRLITGPAGYSEGMTGALEQFWDHSIGSAQNALLARINNTYNRAFSAMIDSNYSEAISGFTYTGAYINVALDFLISSADFQRNIQNFETAENILNLQIINSAAQILAEAGNVGNREAALASGSGEAFNSWRQGVMTASTAVSSEQNLRRSYEEILNELNSLANRIGTRVDDISADAMDLIFGIALRFSREYITSAIRQYTIATEDLAGRVNLREQEFNEGNRLAQGIQGAHRTLEGDITIYFFPTEALAILVPVSQRLELDIQDARALIDQYSSESQQVLSDAEISRLYASTQNLLNRLVALQARNTQVIASARIQSERAASLRFEGDRLFAQAQAAMNRNEFAAARDILTRAAAQYDASLAIQESASLREFRDMQVLNLHAEIISRENELIVMEVRNLVTSARASFFAGHMDQAEETLIRAQNRWMVTNVTPHSDVEYWLGLVRGASTLQASRVIAPTAPLFAEMSQLLSSARRDYDEGLRLLNAGRRADGLVKFNEALEKTREVQIMFPLNQEARLLDLMIEQQVDRPAFNAAFQQRLNEAVAGTRPNVRSPQAFADLQDLAAINPQFPGIGNILIQAEIDMGFRPPPPNPATINRSAQLTREAEPHVRSGVPTRLAIAQAQLEEAVLLNHNNTQAQILLDQVLVAQGATGIFLFSHNDQLLYNEALQMFNQGNFLRANAIVLQLMQNPNNQRSTLLLDLQRRIQTVL